RRRGRGARAGVAAGDTRRAGPRPRRPLRGERHRRHRDGLADAPPRPQQLTAVVDVAKAVIPARATLAASSAEKNSSAVRVLVCWGAARSTPWSTRKARV